MFQLNLDSDSDEKKSHSRKRSPFLSHILPKESSNSTLDSYNLKELSMINEQKMTMKENNLKIIKGDLKQKLKERENLISEIVSLKSEIKRVNKKTDSLKL